MSAVEIRTARIRGFWHQAEPASGALVLTHGAGGDCTMPLLVAVAEGFLAAGFSVLRFDLPFRQKRARGAPFPSGAAADREGLRDAAAWARAQTPGRLFLGGQSYGGRQASMAAAESPDLADGLLLLSYPLHPPGKPDLPRIAHFPAIRTPALFVHGTKDPFGSPAELLDAMKAIRARAKRSEVSGAGHDLNRGRFDIKALAVDPLVSLVDPAISPRDD